MLDSKGTQRLTWPDFVKAVKAYVKDVDELTLKRLFDKFGKDHGINYVELMEAARGTLSSLRLQLGEEAFAQIASACGGSVTLAGLKAAHDSRNHPDVTSSVRTEADVRRDLAETWAFRLRAPQQGSLPAMSRDQREISREQFIEYCRDVSAGYQDDGNFEQLMRTVWKLPPSSRLVGSRKGERGKFASPFHTSEKPVDYTTSAKAQQEDTKANRQSLSPDKTTQATAVAHSPGGVKAGIAQKQTIEAFKKLLLRRGLRGILGFKRLLVVCSIITYRRPAIPTELVRSR